MGKSHSSVAKKDRTMSVANVWLRTECRILSVPKVLTAFVTVTCALWQGTAATQSVFNARNEDEFHWKQLWNATFDDYVFKLAKGKLAIAAKIGDNGLAFVDAISGGLLNQRNVGSTIYSLDFVNDTLAIGTENGLKLVESEGGNWTKTKEVKGTGDGWAKMAPNGQKCYYSKIYTQEIDEYSTANWDKTNTVLRATHNVWFTADVCGDKLAQALFNGNIDVFNTTTGIRLKTILGTNRVWQLSFSSDCSKLVAVGSGYKVRVIDANTQTDIWNDTTQHSAGVTSICWLSADTFATVSSDKSIIVWSVATNVPLSVKQNTHTHKIYSVVCDSSDSLITGSYDKTVAKWRVAKLTETSTVTPTESGTAKPTLSPTLNPSAASFAPVQSQRIASLNSAQTAGRHFGALLLATVLLFALL